MAVAYHHDTASTKARPLPRELGQVWAYALVLAVVSIAFVYSMTQDWGVTLLALAVCVVGAAAASLKVWLSTPHPDQ